MNGDTGTPDVKVGYDVGDLPTQTYIIQKKIIKK